MKKVLLLIITAIVAFSCSKDNNDPLELTSAEQQEINQLLIGEWWRSVFEEFEYFENPTGRVWSFDKDFICDFFGLTVTGNRGMYSHKNQPYTISKTTNKEADYRFNLTGLLNNYYDFKIEGDKLTTWQSNGTKNDYIKINL